MSTQEDEMNIATALYGSGPAFIAYLVNSFLEAGKNISPKSKINEKDIINLFKNVISLNDSSHKLDGICPIYCQQKRHYSSWC
jgi:pyrroline-5-carboxylate reductase